MTSFFLNCLPEFDLRSQLQNYSTYKSGRLGLELGIIFQETDQLVEDFI